MTKRLKAKLGQLPKSPGVYFFRNQKGKIIYVGKAAVLKHRVSSYFQKSRTSDWKTPTLVAEIRDLDWQTTSSEMDALFLESELIKRYQPKYNVELKDEKSQLLVRISLKDPAPTLSLVRRPLDDGATYLGPYMDALGLRRALRYLRKVFPYNTHAVLPQRVCLQYHLGLCPGLEEDKISLDNYRRSLRQLIMFLRGERSLLAKQLEKQMQQAAQAQNYEQAAKLRNQMRALKALSHQVVFGEAERFDLTKDQALNGLAQIVGLPSVPRRIEAYDISHLGGVDNVASMVVFWDGVAAKSEYRKFKMHLGGNDDFAHMREVIARRFGQVGGKWPKPDLLVIDGGKGQLAAALEAMEEQGINIPAIGLAKRQEEIIQPVRGEQMLTSGYTTRRLERDAETLKLLQRLRDEAHRFAVSYQTVLRGRRQTSSLLDEVPGIGPATRKKLIKHFGSLRGVKQAAPDQLAQVLGVKMAARLSQYLAP